MIGFLGIDTSCYTTSVAFLDSAGKLVADLRQPLQVKEGGRGLAQSEMVFQHVRNLPKLFRKLNDLCGGRLELAAVGVSSSPRSIAESYMPVFVVGESFGQTITSITDAPLYKLSHQESHIFAGVRSAGWPNNTVFLAVHISGGTTEVVRVTVEDKINIEILGGSKDLHAGQFIDRVGVALGLPFPAGSHLESLALKAEEISNIPVSCKGMQLSFSGPETHVKRCITAGSNPAALAAGVQQCIAKSLTYIIAAAVKQTKLEEVLVVGGVAANNFIRSYLTSHLNGIRFLFPDNQYSSDNATGAAYFAFWRVTQCNSSA